MPDDGISLILEADSLGERASEPENEEIEEELEDEPEEDPEPEDEDESEPEDDERYASLEAKYNALMAKFQEFSASPPTGQQTAPPSAEPITLPELDDDTYDNLLRGNAADFNKYMKQVAESVQTQTLKTAREKIRAEVLGEIDPIVSTRLATERFFDAEANEDLRPFRTLVGQAINDLIAEKADIKDVNTALAKAGERVRESLALAQNSAKGKGKKKKPALPGSRTSPRKQQKSGKVSRTTQMLEDIAAVMSD